VVAESRVTQGQVTQGRVTQGRPALGRPRSARADQAIRDATRKLLAEQGYAAVTMEGVAARAEVAKTTLYRRWGSKAELVTDAVAEFLEAVPVTDQGSLRADVTAVVDTVAELFGRPLVRVAYLNLVAEAAHDDALRRRLNHAIRDRFREAVHAGRDRAVARGELAADADITLVYDVLAGTLLHRMFVLDEPADATFRQSLVNFTLAGLDAR
jgi:AcrR family transcriptional regulator